MHFTLSQAAKELGVSKSTISKAIVGGRLSAERLPEGSFRIEAAELFRVFPRKQPEQAPVTVREQARTAGVPQETAPRTGELENEVRHLRELLEREREENRRLVTWLDEEKAERRALQRQLTAPERPQEAPVTSAAVTHQPKAPKGFLARWLERG